MSRVVRGRLVESHRIRKRNIEYFVVSRSYAMKHVGQGPRIIFGELIHASEVAAADEQNLERPNSPEGNQPDEAFIFKNNSGSFLLFECDVIAQEAAAARLPIRALGQQFFVRLAGNRCGCPDLAMRVRIAGSHHRAAVLEDLDVVDVFPSAEFTKLVDPSLYDTLNLADLHCGEGEIMPRRKADDTADAGFAFSHDQAATVSVEPRAVSIRLERGKIVVEYEGRAVSRIADAASARIPRTEITVWVVGRFEGGLYTGDFSLPWPRSAMWRYQNPFAG